MFEINQCTTQNIYENKKNIFKHMIKFVQNIYED